MAQAVLINEHISAYNGKMKRKPGTLLPIEESILTAATRLRQQGVEEFHGFGIAKEIQGETKSRFLTGHGTLYRALGRLEKIGFLSSRWEDPEVAAQQARPRRKFYCLTGATFTARQQWSFDKSSMSPTSGGPVCSQLS